MNSFLINKLIHEYMDQFQHLPEQSDRLEQRSARVKEWMNSPQKAFNNRTPNEMIKSGDDEDVIIHLRSLLGKTQCSIDKGDDCEACQ